MKQLTRACRFFAHLNKPKYIPANGKRPWLVPKMNSALESYQLQGVAFMRWRELSAVKEEPKGGLLGDEMGLGKTVQMITNIIDGRPNKESLKARIRTTLIVVPSYELALQFKNEIQVHVKEEFCPRTMIYDSGQRTSCNYPLKELSRFDVM
jgi:DNA repair protein RAD16